MLLLAFLALTPRLLLGFLIVRWMWRSVDLKDLLVQIFLAGLVGIGISSLVSLLWIWAGLDLGAYAIFETIGAFLLLIFILWKQRPGIFEFFKNLRLTINRRDALWLGVLTAGFFIYAGGYWVNSMQNPHGWWDAWANWNVVARFVYRGGEHWTDTFLRITSGNPDYPLLLAMSNTTSWELLSRETVRGPMALAFFFAVSLPGLLFSLLNRLRRAAQASLGTIVLITMPFVANFGMSQYADLPEACYLLASAGLIPIYLSSREKAMPILAGLMAGLAGWTKNEGLTFVVISVIAWIWIGYLLREKAALKNFLIGLAFPLAVIVLFKVFLAPRSELITGRQGILELMLDPDRYKVILSFLVEGRFSLWNMGDGPVSVVAPLIVYAVVMGKTKLSTHGIMQVMLVVLAQWAVYLLIFVITPYEMAWHIKNSLSRLYLHLFPLILLCLFLWLRSPDELLSKSGDRN